MLYVLTLNLRSCNDALLSSVRGFKVIPCGTSEELMGRRLGWQGLLLHAVCLHCRAPAGTGGVSCRDASKWKILDMIGISTIPDVSHRFLCPALSFGRTFGLSTGWRASRMLHPRSEVLSGEKALPPCLGEVRVLSHLAWFLWNSLCTSPHAKICAPLLDLTETSQHLPSRDTGPVKVQWHSCNCKGLIWNPPVVSGLWPLLWWAVFWETNSQRAAACGRGKVRAPFLGGEVGLSAWGFDKWSVKEKSWDLHILSYSSLRYNRYNCIFAPGKGSGGQTPCQLKIGLITWSWLVYFVFFEGWSSFRLVTSETAAKG